MLNYYLRCLILPLRPEMPKLSYLGYFHGSVGLIYFSAFYSLQVQFMGLFGINGLLPAADFVQRVRSHLGVRGLQLLSHFPSLAVVAPDLGINSDAICELMLILGAISGICVALGFRSSLCFAVMFACYLSLVNVGQTFMSFQWDSLLLEVGFLCIFSSYIFYAGPDNPKKEAIFHWCYRFLAFKLMFSAGIVKLQALCPTWENLTALEYHFATQCIPTPLAWFAHQMPPILLRVGVAATLIIEIPLAFFLIVPFLHVRRFGAILQIFLQLLILLTGNYNFFNLLTMALMIPVCADDNVEYALFESEWSECKRTLTWISQQLHMILTRCSKTLTSFDSSVNGRLIQISASTLFVALSTSWMIRYDDSNHNSSLRAVPWWSGDQLSVKTKWADLRPYMQSACAVGIILPGVSCASYIIAALYYIGLEYRATLFFSAREFRSSHHQYSASPIVPDNQRRSATQPSLVTKVKDLFILSFRLLSISIYGAIALVWIFLSARMLSGIGDVNPFIPSFVNTLSTNSVLSRAVSGYGLFRRMTGVGEGAARGLKTADNPYNYLPSIVARPEIVLEGLHPVTNKWIEIPFRYKPTDLHTAPPFNAPHQPRLDWQMWFAALANYQSNPWLVHLICKLHRLDNQGVSPETVNVAGGAVKRSRKKKSKFQYPEILALLDERNYPFKAGDPPAAIRAVIYDYDFTRLNSPWARTIPHAEILPDNITFGAIVSTAMHDMLFGKGSKDDKGKGSSNSASFSSSAAPHNSKESDRERRTTAAAAWWYRRNAREYLPPIDKNNPSVENFLKSNGIAIREYQTPKDVYEQCVAASGDEKAGSVSNLIMQFIQAPSTVVSAVALCRDIFNALRNAAENKQLQQEIHRSALKIFQVVACNTLHLQTPVRLTKKKKTAETKETKETRSSFVVVLETFCDHFISTNFDVTVARVFLSLISVVSISHLLSVVKRAFASRQRRAQVE